MRYAALTIAASVLAADTALAGTLHAHRAHQAIHNRDLVEDVEVVTIFQTVTVQYDGSSPSTSSSISTSSVAPNTTTVSISSVQSTSTAAPLNEDMFLAASSSSSTTTPSSTTSTTAAGGVFAAVSSVVADVTAAVAKVLPTTLATTTKASSAAATTAAATASSTITSSSGKKGLPYNTASLLSAFLGGSTKYWAYNWGSSSDGLSSSFEYVPMLWGLSSTFTSGWSSAVKTAIASGTVAILAYNEPDLDTQSNIGYADAASSWSTYMEPFAGQVLIGSPSVTNGGPPMGLSWLTNFMDACSDCTIDFCPIHWYDSASNVDYFKSYMAEAQTACGGRPIWITEFGATGSDSEVATFLETVIPWLDEQDYIHRYAYFMAEDGVLLSGTSLSTIGQAFADTS